MTAKPGAMTTCMQRHDFGVYVTHFSSTVQHICGQNSLEVTAHPCPSPATIRECHRRARRRRYLRSAQGNARAALGLLLVAVQFPADYCAGGDETLQSPESTLAGTSSPAPAIPARRSPMPRVLQRTPLLDRVAGLQ